MAELRKKEDLSGIVQNRAQALAYATPEGQEIAAAQRTLNANRTNQKLSMQDYLNDARAQRTQINRQSVSNRAMGMTAGGALFNQQQAATSVGNSIAQTQSNYNKFTQQANAQEIAYNEQLGTISDAMEGDVAAQLAQEDQTNIYNNARDSGLTTASNWISGLGTAASVIAGLIPGFGTAAAIGISGLTGALAGGLGAAAAEGADGGDIATGALIQGGIGAALGAIPGLKGAGKPIGGAVESVTTQGIKAGIKETTKGVAKEAAEGIVADSASRAGTMGASGLLDDAIKEVTPGIVDDAFNQTFAQGVLKGAKGKSLENVASTLGTNGDEVIKTISKTIETNGKQAFTNIDNYLASQGLMGKELEATRAVLQQQAMNGLRAEATLQLRTAQKTAADAIMAQKGFFSRTGSKLTGMFTGANNYRAGFGATAAQNIFNAQTGAMAAGKSLSGITKAGNAALGTSLLKQGTKVGLKAGLVGGAGALTNQFTSGAAQKRISNDTTKERWRSVFDQIGRPDLIEKMGW